MSTRPARDGRLATLSAALLTGGASWRMGRDEAHMEIEGAAAATRIARLLASLFEEVLLVGGDPPQTAPGRRVPDPEGPVCALRGLVAALEAARTARVLVVATDLPLLTPELVLALVAWPEAQAVVPETGDGRHPLCAIYRRADVLPVARARLARGELALRGLLDELDVSVLARDDVARLDPDARALTIVNTPADLADLRERWGGDPPASNG